ncbi:hypothetical protein [Moritella viscosa]|uniref:Uncharacterized protein n=1 Tax=Moritella viscosa TaxID=80854 RepID=A0A090IEH8_9GAMM|nr:hypothetical protein [Moritella viscosa]CED59157.1 putative uncharacterized protein [Moritella viscosa]SGY87132.1 Putative uncharacterized protein [Moritella viscosa]SGZ03840.1 Putative uncharacterized protein [Moritella viscosa]SGZ07622.1 Putative uncharacterized protein [Moritella viscosa]SGZ18065.1 Putative uncharacterized protein [Moritella viscosa]
MLEIIKKILLNTSSNALTEYYQSRLKTSNSAVEVEAILSIESLMTFSEEEDQQRDGVK